MALQEGYNIDVNTGEFFSPEGELVASSYEVWEEVVVPQVLDNYVTKKRSELASQWVHSFVVGFDYYHFTKDFWVHSWGNLIPYHVDTDGWIILEALSLVKDSIGVLACLLRASTTSTGTDHGTTSLLALTT